MTLIKSQYNPQLYINELKEKKETIEHIILKNAPLYKGSDYYDPTLMFPYLKNFCSVKTLEIDNGPFNEKMLEFIKQLPLLEKLSLKLQKKEEISLIKRIETAKKIEVEFKINQEDFTYKLTKIPQSARNWIFEQLKETVLHPPEEMSNNELIGAFIKGDTTIEMPNNTQYGWVTFSNPLIINLSSNGTSFQKIPLSYAQTEGGIDFLASFFTGIPYEFTRWEENGFTLMKKDEK